MNAELYCHQVARIYDKPKEKYPALVRRKRALFQQDNAKSHIAKKTKEKFAELDEVEVLPYLIYTPDAAPSDYDLFRSQRSTFGLVADSSHLIKLRKHARSSSIRSRQNGTSIKSGCLQIGDKRLLKTMDFILKSSCYCF